MLSKVRALLRGGGSSAVAEKPAKSSVVSGDTEVLTYDATDDTPCPSGPILTLEACPICGGAESTKVSGYNRFVLFDRVPDAKAPVYNYSLCHACGVVFAKQRPAGERYRWLLERFEETLGRTEVGAPRPGKFALSSSALTDEERQQLRRMVAHGVFVSGHSGLTRKDYLPSLMNDRLASSLHVEILGSLLPFHPSAQARWGPRGQSPRVLEVRSRLGSICAMLERLYGASCSAMTIFE